MECQNVSSSSSFTLPEEESTNAPVFEKQSPDLERALTQVTLRRQPTIQDASQVLDLPYGILRDTARLEEYTEETALGIIPKRTVSRATGLPEEHELVTFTLNDPENPKNWSKAYKWYITMVVSLTCFVVAFNSSVITSDLEGVSATFGVSYEVALVTITVFVVGFGVGPMVFAPCSELFGRRIVYTITLTLAVIFIIPCAVARNIGTLIVCRLIDGVAFSAPVTLVGGTLADIWRNEERGTAMAVFSVSLFLGPGIGPLIGGYVASAGGWRWLYWIQLILSGIVWILISITVPETYTPVLLSRRAKKLRKETGNEKLATERELDSRPLGEQLYLFLLRPLQLLFREPIVLCLSIYMSVLYGLLYMFFVAYPIIYSEGKGWNRSQTGLTFIPIAIGVVASGACSPIINKNYLRLCATYPNGKPPAEARLRPMLWACWFIPAGLFPFAWTSAPNVSYWGPCISGFGVGFGFSFLYNSASNYLVDTYQHQAASALAAKTFVRSLWGASVVLFTPAMYHKLGYEWAGTLLAFISLACCAIPYVFYFKGAAIRKYSHYAFKDEDEELNVALSETTV